MNDTKQRYHPLTFVAFVLAVLILIAPTQADIVFAPLQHGHIWQAIIVVVISLLVVVLPLVLGQVQTKRHPELWKPRFLTKLTWGIIVLNVAFNITMCIGSAFNRANYPAGRVAAAQGDISNYVIAVEAFKADCGAPPTQAQGFNAFIMNPGVAKWRGPYVCPPPFLRDPWGTEYRYTVTTNGFELRSAGPDKAFGTADDLTNRRQQ
jgi:hypothetical protein